MAAFLKRSPRLVLSLLLTSLYLVSPLACNNKSSNDSNDDSSDADDSSDVDGHQFNLPEVTTWHEHIAPLVLEKCTGCHQEGGIAPFSLESYEQASPWASLMENAILDGSMPPWGAQETDECESIAPYKDDVRLSKDEKSLFSKWVKDGALEGEESKAAAIPDPIELSLSDPSRSLVIPSKVTVEGTSDDFVCFTLDPKITEPVWLTSSQIQPGNSKIVHHALVFIDREGEGEVLADENGQYPCFGGPGTENPTLLGVWAPGAVPASLPDNIGTPLEPGDKLVMQVHYHPTGQGPEIDDSTRVDLKWTTEEPDYIGGVFLIGNFGEEDIGFAGGEGFGLASGPEFKIPAGAKDHVELQRFWLDDGGDLLARFLPVYLWMAGTHMHYVGTDMKITATSPEGDEQCLVQTPEWDFNWQRGYIFEGEVEELPTVYAGDTLTMRCTYDNSLDNPFVREALDSQGLSEPQDVSLGDETLDEMCVGVFGFAIAKKYKSELGF